MNSEQEFYWLTVDGKTKSKWKTPFTPKGKRDIFKLMREQSALLGEREFKIHSSRRGDDPLWISGPWNLIVKMDFSDKPDKERKSHYGETMHMPYH